MEAWSEPDIVQSDVSDKKLAADQQSPKTVDPEVV